MSELCHVAPQSHLFCNVWSQFTIPHRKRTHLCLRLPVEFYDALVGTFVDPSGSADSAYQRPHRRGYRKKKTHLFHNRDRDNGKRPCETALIGCNIVHTFTTKQSTFSKSVTQEAFIDTRTPFGVLHPQTNQKFLPQYSQIISSAFFDLVGRKQFSIHLSSFDITHSITSEWWKLSCGTIVYISLCNFWRLSVLYLV